MIAADLAVFGVAAAVAVVAVVGVVVDAVGVAVVVAVVVAAVVVAVDTCAGCSSTRDAAIKRAEQTEKWNHSEA